MVPLACPPAGDRDGRDQAFKIELSPRKTESMFKTEKSKKTENEKTINYKDCVCASPIQVSFFVEAPSGQRHALWQSAPANHNEGQRVQLRTV